MENLFVIHRKFQIKAQKFSLEYIVWQTCLRQILFASEDQFSKIKPILGEEDEVYSGNSAYEFLLEIICGFHSPMLGETEVFGQFKIFLDSLKLEDFIFYRRYQKVWDQLLVDAKKLRSQYLLDIGASSYGSQVRKLARPYQSVLLIGSGHLAQELLPWLKGFSLTIMVRDLEKEKGKEARKEKGIMSAISSLSASVIETPAAVVNHVIAAGDEAADAVSSEDTAIAPADAFSAEVVVVAAPLDSLWLENFLLKKKLVKLVIDLRGDRGDRADRADREVKRSTENSFSDSSKNQQMAFEPLFFQRITNEVTMPFQYHSLDDIYQDLEKNREKALHQVTKAKLEIRKLSQKLNEKAIYRPMGWDDLCV